MIKKIIITDVWYQWMDEERTEIKILVEDENGEEFSIATVNVENYPKEVRFEGDLLEQSENLIYDLAMEVAEELGYILEGYAQDED